MPNFHMASNHFILLGFFKHSTVNGKNILNKGKENENRKNEQKAYHKDIVRRR